MLALRAGHGVVCTPLCRDKHQSTMQSDETSLQLGKEASGKRRTSLRAPPEAARAGLTAATKLSGAAGRRKAGLALHASCSQT